MPAKIKILSDDVVNKIAAGEIIERPSSVAKELIENSLDAGATQITVEIEEGGQKLIRVTDNGSGMSADDARLALERHSTSKIASATDLENIHSYGFRGEALPSISAVSRLVLTTRPANDIEGTLVEVEGGTVKKAQKTGCPAGTTVMVRDLFFNTPARLKFIKTSSTETGHITNTVIEEALANPQVAFKVKSHGKDTLNIPAVRSSGEQAWPERVSSVFGKDILETLLRVKAENKFLKIDGFISKPSFSRVNRNQQFIFVNKRSIRSRLINHAVYNGYQGMLMSNRHPVILLSIDINPELIDVNVHPTKREIRFTNEQGAHELVSNVIKDTLRSGGIVPSIEEAPGKDYSGIGGSNGVKEAIGEYFARTGRGSAGKADNIDLFEKTKFVFSPDRQQEKIAVLAIQPLAQVNDLYIIASDEQGLLIIDQHAASERIMYETFKKDYHQAQVKFQELLLPVTLELSAGQAEVVEENLANLSKLGFTIEKFGINTFIVKTMPVLLGNYPDKQVMLDIFDSLDPGNSTDISAVAKDLGDKALKIMACRAAIKAGDKLSREQMYALMEGLENIAMPNTCPHGRPSIIRITFEELEKRFKRT
jgi:DNA mismatch repair protein MutL